MFKPKEYTERELEIFRNHLDDHGVLMKVTSSHLAAVHQETQLKIIVSTEDLAKAQGYDLIPAKAQLVSKKHPTANVTTECYVAFGRWQKLLPKLTEQKIDIVEHFRDLLPNTGTGIGLVTCQNGIQNAFETDFKDMCLSITKAFNSFQGSQTSATPLFIGLYNRTNGVGWGFLQDFNRLDDSWTYNPVSIYTLRQMYLTFAQALFGINRDGLRWTHIAHSEGGLLSNHCLTNSMWGISPETKRLLQHHLITLVYGGVDSIPNDCVHYAINNYSVKDIAFRYAMPYLDKFPEPAHVNTPPPKEMSKKDQELVIALQKAYKEGFCIQKYPHPSTVKGRTVTVLKCVTEKKNLCPISGDHAFQGTTYQNELEANIKELKMKFGVLY